MKILTKIKAKFYGWKKQPSREEVDQLVKHYRTEIFNDEALELLAQEDIKNLICISKYADMGRLQAIEAAFCLGYAAGKEELKNRIKKHFGMEGD